MQALGSAFYSMIISLARQLFMMLTFLLFSKVRREKVDPLPE